MSGDNVDTGRHVDGMGLSVDCAAPVNPTCGVGYGQHGGAVATDVDLAAAGADAECGLVSDVADAHTGAVLVDTHPVEECLVGVVHVGVGCPRAVAYGLVEDDVKSFVKRPLPVGEGFRVCGLGVAADLLAVDVPA